MRPSVQSINSSRSLALQQYDESKKQAAAAGTVAAAGTRVKAATASVAQARAAAAQQYGDDWTLCGWEDAPSVPVAARVASARLRKHEPAALLAAPCSPQAAAAAGGSSSNGCSSAGRRRTAVAGSSSSSPKRRTTQGAQASPGRSRQPKQQLCPAVRRLQLGEEDSFGAAAEHYRPPAAGETAAEEAAAAAAGPDDGAAGRSNDSSTSRSCGSETATRDTCSAAGSCHLPSLSPHVQQTQQQHWGAVSTAQTSTANGVCSLARACATGSQHCLDASGAELPAQDSACDATGGICEDDSALYAPLTGSTAARGSLGPLLLPNTHSRGLLHSTSSSSINSNILALQQRLLLHQPAAGLLGSSASGSSCIGSSSGVGGSSSLLVGCRSSAGLPFAGWRSGPGAGSAGLLMQGASVGPGVLGQQAAAAAGGSGLHARMATTAARAQMLLTRDLSCLVAPHAPRDRPAAAAAGTAPGVAAEDSRSLDAQWPPQPQQQQQQQQEEMLLGLDAAGTSLRFLNSSRPSSRPHSASRSRAGNSSGGVAVTATASTGAAGSPATPAAAAGDVQHAAGICGAGGQSSNGFSGGSSSSSSTGGPLTSKGLSAAAEYMACRATVGQLLQRINSQKAVATSQQLQQQQLQHQQRPDSRAGPAGALPRTTADTVFSRDGSSDPMTPTAAAGALGKVPAKQLLGLQASPLKECTSLKAYQVFQAAKGVDSSGAPLSAASSSARPGTNGSRGSSRPSSGGIGPGSSSASRSGGHHSLLKSISAGGSGGSVQPIGLGSGFELRATASLRKCGSSKE